MALGYYFDTSGWLYVVCVFVTLALTTVFPGPPGSFWDTVGCFLIVFGDVFGCFRGSFSKMKVKSFQSRLPKTIIRKETHASSLVCQRDSAKSRVLCCLAY